MKRWNRSKRADVERPDIDAFLVEMLAVCKRHGFSLGHEDGQVAFEVYDYDKYCDDWLLEAVDCTRGEPK